MQTFDLDYPQPSLATWSRDARPVRLVQRDDDQVPAPTDADAAPGGLDDLLFGCSSGALILVTLAIAVAAFVA